MSELQQRNQNLHPIVEEERIERQVIVEKNEIIKEKRQTTRFRARKSMLDREDLNIGAPPMRGFLALFWIAVALYAAVSMYRLKGKHFMGVSLQLWHAAYCDFEALLVMIAAIYLFTYTALAYQLLLAKGILDFRNDRARLLSKIIIQTIPMVMALFVASYRHWPHLQTGSLICFSISMYMKMHSYLAINQKLNLEYHLKARRRTTGENRYPNNLTILNYTRFLWFPTLIYQLEYPRTEKIRWGYLAERTTGIWVIFGIFYVVLGHYVHPVLLTVNTRNPLDIFVDLLLPCLVSALLLFFLVFEYLLNWAAELTRFADREFYSDWWNSTDMAEFARKWNVPVHRFLQHHIYDEARLYHSSFTARFVTFFYSSIFHELVMSATAGRPRLWMLSMQMSQLPLMYVAKITGLSKSPFLANCIWWLLIILGIPLLVLLYSRDTSLLN